MIYSYIKPTGNVVESVEATRSEELVSIVYNEYCNYKEMLESCTDESARPILEAQVKVLYEVSIKDIIDKIKDALSNFIKWVKDLVDGIINKIRELFEHEKVKNIKSRLAKAKSVKESAILTEADSEDGSGKQKKDTVPYYWWTNGSEQGSISTFYMKNVSTLKFDFWNWESKIADNIIRISNSKDPVDDNEINSICNFDIPASYIKSLEENRKDFKFHKKFEKVDSKRFINKSLYEYRTQLESFDSIKTLMTKELDNYYKDEQTVAKRFNNDSLYRANDYEEINESKVKKGLDACKDAVNWIIKAGQATGVHYKFYISKLGSMYISICNDAEYFLNHYVSDEEDKEEIRSLY